MTLDYVQIGANIRSVRQERKISQAKLSEYTNLSTAHISHIESGKTKVSLQSLSDIADALGTTLDTLIYGAATHANQALDADVTELLADCTSKERAVILESARQIKKALRQEI